MDFQLIVKHVIKNQHSKYIKCHILDLSEPEGDKRHEK